MHASELYSDFITWGYKTPPADRAGTKRRVRREDAARIARAAHFVDTPNHPPSRQVKRRSALLAKKRPS